MENFNPQALYTCFQYVWRCRRTLHPRPSLHGAKVEPNIYSGPENHPSIKTTFRSISDKIFVPLNRNPQSSVTKS